MDLGLAARYTFDGNLEDATTDSENAGIIDGTPEFGCGVEATALVFDGSSERTVRVPVPAGNTSNVNRVFQDGDFSVSLYFKPTGTGSGTQYLLAKRDTNCMFGQYFLLQYLPATRSLSVVLRQDNQVARIDRPIVDQSCFQHVVVSRADNVVRLYVNGEEIGEVPTTSRVDVRNDGALTIGTSTCFSAGESPFEGLMDELRVYERALRRDEVALLYTRPDRILNERPRLFLGESIDVELNSPCGMSFQWSPTEGVSDPASPNPTITPTTAGTQTYTVRIEDSESFCTAVDSISLQVIDPDNLDCSQIFLPKAFTPNGIGPAQNETFGISNPFAVPDLRSFEIYDRYGAQMFQSTDPFARWDGTFKGKEVEPGIAVWRLVYECEGAEEVLSGSVVVLR